MIERVIGHNIDGEKKVTSKSIYINIPLYVFTLNSPSLFFLKMAKLNNIESR